MTNKSPVNLDHYIGLGLTLLYWIYCGLLYNNWIPNIICMYGLLSVIIDIYGGLKDMKENR